MKRMLFNATHPEELRVAIVDGQRLLDLDIESAVRAQRKGNIYKGKITRVEPSLEAAFVEYGAQRQGFLPLKEISRNLFQNYSPSIPMAQVKIENVVSEGMELVVQVDKDERGTKGAALTTFISLAGRYLVLMPNNPKGGGISRRISGSDRAELRDALSGLEVPSEHALIARTAGIGRSQEELGWDLDFLFQLWSAIENAATERAAPFLIFQESNLIVRALRDYLRGDISEIVIDEPGIFERASKFMDQVMPNAKVELKLYEDTVPLFSRFQIEHQIETAYSREVRLPSGGAIVIDHTEAVVAVDVNSAKATKGSDIEETALQTNLEAVDEVARQLRIRDLGGLIVIDLIDMSSNRNQRIVENRLHEALKSDRARVQVGRISRFGLLEMSRQRLRSSISDSNYVACPRCEGTGSIRSVTSSALSLLRILEEEALKENTEAIHAHLPLKTATFLLNEKRHELNQIEVRLATSILVIPTAELEYPHFQIKRLKADDVDEVGSMPSHKIAFELDEDAKLDPAQVFIPEEAPSINLDDIASPDHPPAPEQAAEPEKPAGFLTRLWKALSGESSAEPQEEVQTEQPKKSAQKPRGRQNQNRSGQGQRRGGGAKKPSGQGKPAQSKSDDQRKSGGNRRRSDDRGQGNPGGQGNQNRDDRGNRKTADDQKGQARQNKPRNQGNKARGGGNSGERKGNSGNQGGQRSTTRTSWNRGSKTSKRPRSGNEAPPADNIGNQAPTPGNQADSGNRKPDVDGNRKQDVDGNKAGAVNQ